MLGRLQRAWRALDGDQRLAGLAALALLVTLFLPWYQATVVEAGKTTTPTFSAFGVFSFVEAAVFLVSLGVFLLLFARGEKRGFHLPGGDGTVIFGAGLWAAVLLLWRVFDRPDISRAVSDGITWGLFFAFLAAGALAAAGWKIRAAHRPEPPLVVDGDRQPDYGHRGDAPSSRRRRPARGSSARRDEQATQQLTLDDATAATQVAPRDPAPASSPEPPGVPRSAARPSPPEPAPAPDAGPQPIPGDRPLWADEEPDPTTESAPREPRPTAPPPRSERRARVFDQDEIEPGEIPRAPDR